MNQNERNTIAKAVESIFGYLPKVNKKIGDDHMKFILGAKRKTTLEYYYKDFNDGSKELMGKLTLRIPNCKVRSCEDYTGSWKMTVTGQKDLIQVLLQELL